MDIERTERIANLAKLSFSDEQLERFTVDMENIIRFVDKLADLDTADMEAVAHVMPEVNRMREDVVTPSMSREDALKNAPQNDGLGYTVTKII
ncbi:Asp-tRNA(Asn)/Glu-tRNA(Gln) amidotransferase subunit GatC [Eubacteriales bacterium OttesenSCG-928-N14]|nr:Asp-tRNA(Asn)/Glu-tRNA(Gln) amidotransferase subunit GatC [Eubacteriales bacterium OttesenSCG-928-N14]